MTSSVPYAFVPGTRAMASQVNANFIAVLNKIEEALQLLATEKQNILTYFNQQNLLNLKKDLSNIDETGQGILDLKANADLSNITIPSDYSQTLNTAGIRTVVEAYESGNSWCRVYSDGWVEQGGIKPPYSDNNAVLKNMDLSRPFSVQVTLLDNYNITVQGNMTVCDYVWIGAYHASGSFYSNFYARWEVRGYMLA